MGAVGIGWWSPLTSVGRDSGTPQHKAVSFFLESAKGLGFTFKSMICIKLIHEYLYTVESMDQVFICIWLSNCSTAIC